MTKKIFQSIFIVALVVVLAGIGIATSFLYDYFNTSQVKQLKAELSLVADTVNEVGVEYFDNFNSSVFYWRGLPFPSPGDLPDLGIEPVSPAWQADSLPPSHL